MKKIIYIISAVAVLFSLFSCAKEEGSLQEATLKDGKVELSFDVTLPEMPVHATKAFSDDATLSSMVLYIFGGAGTLKEYDKATLVRVSPNKYTFSVKVTPQRSEAHVHFVANGPDPDISAPTEYTESGLISSLYTESTSTVKDAYWQKVTLPYGIGPSTTFSGLELVRNFSKITLSVDPSVTNFTMSGYALVNTPTRGYIAPYCSGDGRFIENFQNKSFDQIRAEYGTDGRVKERFNTALPTAADMDMQPKYTFGRIKYDASTPTYIIVHGIFTDAAGASHDCFYKVNITDDSGYMPLFRNFHYILTIKSVNIQGSASPEDASHTPGTGDVMVDVETTQTSSVFNGDEKLELEYTSKVFNSAQTDRLTVRFYPDAVNNPTYVDNSRISWEGDGSGDVLSSFSRNSTEFLLSVKAPSSTMRRQEIVVHAGGIRQVLTLYSITNIPIEVSSGQPYASDPSQLSSTVDVKVQTPVDIQVRIPSGLPDHVFPIVFKVALMNNTLGPKDSHVVVRQENGGCYFTRTLDATEYKSLPLTGSGSNERRRLTLHFETNVPLSATTVTVSSPLTNSASSEIRNIAYKRFTDLQYSDYSHIKVGDGNPVTFSFRTQSTDPVTIVFNGLVPAAGETRLTHISSDAAAETDTYILNSPVNGLNTLSLKTNSHYNYLCAKLSADGYMTERKGLRRVAEPIVIPTNYTYFPRNKTYIDPYTGVTINFSGVGDATSSHYQGDQDAKIEIKCDDRPFTQVDIHIGTRGYMLKVQSGGGSVDCGKWYNWLLIDKYTWTGSSKRIVLVADRSNKGIYCNFTQIDIYGLEQYIPAL